MSADQFSQRPFAVGSLIGVRSFRVTAGGVLTGVMQQVPWTDGVNEAVCVKPMGSGHSATALALYQFGVSSAEMAWSMTNFTCALRGTVNLRKRPKHQPPPPTPEPVPHQAGTLDCTCGFYAYFDDGHNPHHGFGNVLGIVEGFGVCTTGTRGFRSSKARLCALVAPPESVHANYPDAAVFPSLDRALAEFPLTPVEGAQKPEPFESSGITFTGGYVTLNVTVDTRAFDQAMRSVLRAYQSKPMRAEPPETTRARALEARRNRNTGPDDRRGIDGHYRRRAQ